MLKAFKYRLYPTSEQAKAIDQTFGVCRLVYNLGLEIKMRAYQEQRVIVSAYDLQRQIKDLREEYAWVKSVSREALDASLNNLGRAYDKFFSGSGYPKFKKKSGRQSYSVKGRAVRLNTDENMISIPKISNISIRLSRPVLGDIRTSTVSKTPTGKYFISILAEDGNLIAFSHKSGNAIGIDLGITTFATLSTGEKVDNPKYHKNAGERLKTLQRKASKKKKGSRNHKKALAKVSLLHEKIVNRRLDFPHKASTKVICDNQVSVICLESLSVVNMIKNRSLSSSISDASWSEFVRQLEYKALWCGKKVIKIDRFFPSSKICSSCGLKVSSLPLSIREWDCECGAHHDRDINAAINIRNSGMGSPGEPVEQSAMKGCYEAGINVNALIVEDK